MRAAAAARAPRLQPPLAARSSAWCKLRRPVAASSAASPFREPTEYWLPNHRQFDRARLVGRVPHALRRLLKIRGLGEHDVRHEALRIAVIEREPRRLDLHH